MSSYKTEKRKKLRYNRRKDPNVNSYFDNDHRYIYTFNMDYGDQIEKKCICLIDLNDYSNGSDIILALRELDRYEDEQEEIIHQHTDKVFQEKLHRYESEGDDRQLSDPWETVCYANDCADLFSLIFPDDKPEDDQREKLEAFIQTLQPQQIDLFYQHFGAQRTLEELRQEEQERTGHEVSQQAFSDRWNKILARICKHFGIPKPRKRKEKND